MVLVTVTLLDVTYYNFTNTYKTETFIKMETLQLVWPSCWSLCANGISSITSLNFIKWASAVPVVKNYTK